MIRTRLHIVVFLSFSFLTGWLGNGTGALLRSVFLEHGHQHTLSFNSNQIRLSHASRTPSSREGKATLSGNELSLDDQQADHNFKKSSLGVHRGRLTPQPTVADCTTCPELFKYERGFMKTPALASLSPPRLGISPIILRI